MTPATDTAFARVSVGKEAAAGDGIRIQRPFRAAGILPPMAHAGVEHNLLGQIAFLRTVGLERKRSERSGDPFLLMRLDLGNCVPENRTGKRLGRIFSALAAATRETDVIGWHEEPKVIGVVFSEISFEERAIPANMLARVRGTLQSYLTSQQYHQLDISFDVFPKKQEHAVARRAGGPVLHSEGTQRGQRASSRAAVIHAALRRGSADGSI